MLGFITTQSNYYKNQEIKFKLIIASAITETTNNGKILYELQTEIKGTDPFKQLGNAMDLCLTAFNSFKIALQMAKPSAKKDKALKAMETAQALCKMDWSQFGKPENEAAYTARQNNYVPIINNPNNKAK